LKSRNIDQSEDFLIKTPQTVFADRSEMKRTFVDPKVLLAEQKSFKEHVYKLEARRNTTIDDDVNQDSYLFEVKPRVDVDQFNPLYRDMTTESIEEDP